MSSFISNAPVAVVTGGGGFIGSHMVDLLVQEGYTVRVIDNFVGGHRQNLAHHINVNPVKIYEVDILDLEIDCEIFNNVDHVFHFAGIGDIVPSIERPLQYMDVNVNGTVKVLECSRYSNVEKFVYAASSSCYGLAAVPTAESQPLSPQYPYALSKMAGEQAALHWNQVYGLPVNSIRIFNAYGTRVRTTGAYGAVFGVFLRQKLAQKPFTVVGDGNQTRDFIYVTDVCRAFLAAAVSSHAGRVYNLGAGDPKSINELVSLIGGDVEYLPRRPGEPDCTWADITQITADLGWQPKVTFDQGVGMMMDDILHWSDAPLWDADSIAGATEKWFKYLNSEAED